MVVMPIELRGASSSADGPDGRQNRLAIFSATARSFSIGTVGERTMIRFLEYFRALTLGFLVMKVLGLSSSASAQTPKGEISAGYQVLHALNDTLPVGWYVDLAGNMNRWFGIEGEVGGAYRIKSEAISINRTLDVTSKLHTFMGGVCLSARINRRIILYHPVLIGGAHASMSTDTVGVTLSPSETKFALQPGIGVNLMVTDKIGLQVAADYRRVFLGEDRGVENESRFTIGIVVPLAVPDGNRAASGVVAGRAR